jgi:pilus assembly protein FimV
VRRLTKTLAMVSLLAPAGAYSLGIGSIKVHSGLNQNLNAEIALVMSANEDVADVKISLAPPAKFDQAKVPWSFFLSKLKFVPVVKANGATVIKVTSNEVLKEPFLDFLLEVSWPKGNLYRQFTVLLEPPAAYHKVSSSDTVDYESVEEPKTPQPQRQHDFDAQAASKPVITTPRHKRHVVHVHRSSNNVTRKHDTLWKVAERVKRDSEPSVEQMMLALYEANPQAFYKDNINALLPNKKLTVPKKDEVLKLSRDEADAEFNQHMRAWKNNVPIAHHEPPVAEEPVSTDKQLTLIAPTDATVADDAATTLAHDSVTATGKATNEKPKEGDANGQNGDNKTTANVVAPTQDVKGNKVNELENELAAIQKSLALKEQQLQALQKGIPTAPTNKEIPTAPNEIAVTTPVIKAPEQHQPPVTKPETQPQPVEIPTATSTTDPTYLWVAGIGGGLLSLIGWLWWRKRKFDQEFDGESMFAPSSMITPSNTTIKPASHKESTAPDTSTQAVGTGVPEDNSFLNEFTASDFEVFDTSHVEIDPISETDVYLAYGRYQQAEELMRQAIKDQPDNDEYKLKLLEIFCATERKKDFVNYATDLADAGKKDQAEFWAKVIEMGREVWSDLTLSSGEELFSSEHETTVENIYANLAPAEAVSHDIADDDDSQFDIATFDSEFEESLMGSAPELFTQALVEEPSDFDFNSGIDIDAQDEPQNNHSIDFDLGAFATNNKNSNTQVADNSEKESLRFSLDKPELTLEKTPTIETVEFNVNNDEEEIIDEFALDNPSLSVDSEYQELDLSAKSTTSSAFSTDDTKSYNIGEDLDFDLDFDLAAPETVSTIHYFDADEASFDFMDLDELETKLDLAKAYIDMGDSDAAKEIIAEVLDKGNTEQVKTARSLFDSMA